MNEQRSFAIQTFLITFVLNGLLMAGVYTQVGESLIAANLQLIFWAGGALLTLILWLLIVWMGRRLAARVAEGVRATAPTEPVPAEPAPVAKAPPVREAPVAKSPPARTLAGAAVQMLAILQRQGRLIDFLQEDLSLYEDNQIGAAVRNVHAGCRQALDEHVQLEPIYSDSEGSQVSVAAGFDAYTIRLSGNVVGDPPFSGTLRHRGWRAAKVDLPEQALDEDASMIVAAAEVEVGA